MSLTDRLDSAVQGIGSRRLVDHFDRIDPPDAPTFFRRVDSDIQDAVRRLVDARASYVALPSSLAAIAGFIESRLDGQGHVIRASADGDSPMVRIEAQTLGVQWVGRCELHGALDQLAVGLNRLQESVNAPAGRVTGLLIFCFDADGKRAVDGWREHVAANRLNRLVRPPESDAGPLGFWSEHTQISSGLEFCVRHTLAPMWSAPGDLSGSHQHGGVGPTVPMPERYVAVYGTAIFATDGAVVSHVTTTLEGVEMSDENRQEPPAPTTKIKATGKDTKVADVGTTTGTTDITAGGGAQVTNIRTGKKVPDDAGEKQKDRKNALVVAVIAGVIALLVAGIGLLGTDPGQRLLGIGQAQTTQPAP